jgi:hypothetical protein
MLVNSGAMVAGTYRISSSGSQISAPRRHKMTAPAMNNPRNVSDATVAVAYTAVAPANC